MIDIKQQEELFIAIGNALEKKIVIYTIGGTAMMLRSLKDATLDVDFVFDKKSDRDEFIISLKKLGAKESNITLIYGVKKNTPLMLTLMDCRFDLFMNKIITSTFSDKMKERANQMHEFGKNLIVRSADPCDVIIMKSATSREKDLDDITMIVKKTSINWNILVNEAENQVKLGNESAILTLGERLEKLNNSKAIEIPKSVLDSLFNLLKRQVKKKIRKNSKDL
ncbi:MAG: DUF6036 family nucleotidyltransferase [Nanoarchaeota archaeon]